MNNPEIQIITEDVDSQNDQSEESHQRVSVGLSPRGGIGLNVVDADGNEAGALLTLEEAEQLSARLSNLAGILLHMGFIQVAQQQLEAAQLADQLGLNKKIHLPGR